MTSPPAPVAGEPGVLPAGFPVPPGSRVGTVSVAGGEIKARLTVTDGKTGYAFWRSRLPAAGYRITGSQMVGGIGEISFSGRDCTGPSQLGINDDSVTLGVQARLSRGQGRTTRSAASRPRSTSRGVRLVHRGHPGPGLGRALAELDVPGQQPLQPDIVVRLDVPDLAERGPHLRPGRPVQQQVVALGDDQPDLGRDRDARRPPAAPGCARSRARRPRRRSRPRAGAAAPGSPSRRRSPARPCGRAARAGRARRRRGGSRPSAPTPPPARPRRPAAPPASTSPLPVARRCRSAPARAGASARRTSASRSITTP